MISFCQIYNGCKRSIIFFSALSNTFRCVTLQDSFGNMNIYFNFYPLEYHFFSRGHKLLLIWVQLQLWFLPWALTTGVVLIITPLTDVWQISPLVFIMAHLSCGYMLKRLISLQNRHSHQQLLLRKYLVPPTDTC